MERDEKLRLSADCEWCHCFKQGLFARFYEQSLYWICHTVKPLKPMTERMKGGEPIVYGGLPASSLEALIEQGALKQVEPTGYGWRWPYTAQAVLPKVIVDFAEWRQDALSVSSGSRKTGNGGKDVLAEIVAFNLAAHTPIQAMNAIAGWQEDIRAGLQPS